MSQGIKRGKSPAARNRFNNIGITGRKTGVRVAGKVSVDQDGLENIDEFYKHTSPPEPPAKASTLRTLVSPTPIRKPPSHDTLMGALDLPSKPKNDWIRSPKRGRRITIADNTGNTSDTGELTSATAINGSDEEKDDGPVKSTVGDDQTEDRIEESAGENNTATAETSVEGVEVHVAEAVEGSEVRIEEPAEEYAEDEPDMEEHEDAEMRIEEPTEEPVEDTEEHIEESIEGTEVRFDESSELSEPELTSKRPRKPQSQEGVRRSTRTSVPPLAFWRNEHIEYEYDNRVPKVKNVVRVRHTAEEKRQRRRKRKQLPGLRNLTEVKKVGFYYYDDENYGFTTSGPRPTNQTDPDDDDIAMTTEPVPVLVGGTEQAEEVVLSRHDIEWTKPNNKYQVGIGLVSEGAGSGVLSLAVKGSKPPRSSGTKSIFYLVTCGQVEFHIHSSQFSVGILGQVVVPPNNTYAIKNIGTHPAQLYFVQVEV